MTELHWPNRTTWIDRRQDIRVRGPTTVDVPDEAVDEYLTRGWERPDSDSEQDTESDSDTPTASEAPEHAESNGASPEGEHTPADETAPTDDESPLAEHADAEGEDGGTEQPEGGAPPGDHTTDDEPAPQPQQDAEQEQDNDQAQEKETEHTSAPDDFDIEQAALNFDAFTHEQIDDMPDDMLKEVAITADELDGRWGADRIRQELHMLLDEHRAQSE